jgi:hypothetical protein
MPPFFGDQKYLAAIGQWQSLKSDTPPTIEWQLKIFSRRTGCGYVLSFWKNNLCFPFWAIEKF